MARRTYLFGSKRREDLWLREKYAAYRAGRGLLPICNLCDEPVSTKDDWQESHDPGRAKCFGGRRTGVGHKLCNELHGRLVVTPAFAKSNRVFKKHVGIKGPGLGRHPMRAGRRSRESKTFAHGVQPRLTHAQKHAALMAKRAILTQQSEA